MKSNYLLSIVCSMILPFSILYGFYVILNGDLSAGGGFHGGVLLSTSFLLVHFMKEDHALHFYEIIKIEKAIFLLLIFMALGLIIIYPLIEAHYVRVLFLMAMNMIIGFKVTIGLCGIMLIFIEEGSV